MEVDAFEALTTGAMNLGVERFMVYNEKVIWDRTRTIINPQDSWL